MNLNKRSDAEARTDARVINPLPIIDGLTENMEVDVDALQGKNLKVFIRGADVEQGDVLLSNWRAVGANGYPFDFARDAVLVEDPAEVVVEIANDILERAKGGVGLYSYQIVNQAGQEGEESLRQFCYIGLRGLGIAAEKLPVVHVLEAHERVIVRQSADLRVVVAAYQAIQEGDTVEMTVRRFRSSGAELSPYKRQLSDVQRFNGEPLEWNLPDSQLNTVGTGGRVEISYQITLKGDEVLEPSRPETFTIQSAIEPSTLLPVPKAGDGGSDVIDPGNFLNGLPIVIDAYKDRAVGDYLVLVWSSNKKQVQQVVRLDESSLVTEHFRFTIEQKVLNESVGDAEVFYQFSRAGHALSSQVLLLKVEAPRATPPMPTVRDASSGAGAENYQIDASKLRRNGAFVIIPPQPKLRPGEHYDVHWHGHANGGRTVIEVPAVDDPDEPIVCNVPVDFVAANMGETDKDESRRFDVFYRIVDKDAALYWESPPLRLLIAPLAATAYSRIQCPEANTGGELKLTPAGASLTLDPWVFINEGHPLSIHLTGVGPQGEVISETLRNAVPVSQQEHVSGVQEALKYDVLQTLAFDRQFSVWASTTFDGQVWREFPRLNLTLRK
ncbi:MAG: hypothetical protein RR517_24285 [Pseudomonas sp.]